MKDLYVYPAIFSKTATGYSVHFPDLPGCISVGKTLEEAHRMVKEALGLHLWGMEQDGDPVPTGTSVDMLETEPEDVVGLVEVWMLPVRAELDTRSVKKTLTIPAYLNVLAEKKKINFSRVLQSALEKTLGIETDYGGALVTVKGGRISRQGNRPVNQVKSRRVSAADKLSNHVATVKDKYGKVLAQLKD